jgi:hypothetical protein
MHQGTLVEDYLDPSGTRRLRILLLASGAFAYVEEFRETYFEAEDGYPADEVWAPSQVSGFFGDLDAARSDAFVMALWARNIETRRI